MPDSGFTRCVIPIPSEQTTRQYCGQGWRVRRRLTVGKTSGAPGVLQRKTAPSQWGRRWWILCALTMKISLKKTLKIATVFTKKHPSWLTVPTNIYLIKLHRSKVPVSECFCESHRGIQAFKEPSFASKPRPKVLMNQGYHREEECLVISFKPYFWC